MNIVAIRKMLGEQGYKLDHVDTLYRADRKDESRRRRYPTRTYGHGYFPRISVTLTKDEEQVCFSNWYDNLGTFAADLMELSETIRAHCGNVKIKKYDYYEDEEEEEE